MKKSYECHTLVTLPYLTQGTTKKKEVRVYQVGDSTVVKVVDEVM